MGPDPIDYSEPESTIMRKAGEGAIAYALKHGGNSDVQVHNGLRSHRAGILDEVADIVSRNIDMQGEDLADGEDVVAFIRRMAREIRSERTYGDG